MAELEEKLNAILGDQQAMGQIMALARSLSGEGEKESAEIEGEDRRAEETPDLSGLLGQLDPAMMQAGLNLFRKESEKGDRSAALLEALKPFLREERREKLDRAVRIARLTRLIRLGLGAVEGKESGGHV